MSLCEGYKQTFLAASANFALIAIESLPVD